MNHRKSIWITLVLGLIVLPQVALGWWNDDWKFRKRMTVDSAVVSAAVSAGLSEFSLPIRLDAGNFAYFSDLEKSGADLRFVASDDRTPLEYRIERIDTTAQLAVVWVKIPIAKLRAEHSYLWLYYNAAKAAPATSNTIDDAGIVGSYDFADTQGPPRDATAYASNALASTARAAVPGVVDFGLGFDAKSSVALPASPSFSFEAGKGTSVSAWIRVEQNSPPGLVYSQSGTDGHLQISAGPNQVVALFGAAGKEVRVSAALTDGWHHIGVAAGGRLALYVDGQESQALAAPRVHLNGGPVLGAAGALESFSGALDALRTANTARPAGWFDLQYLTQKSDGTAITFGADEAREAGGISKEFDLIWRLLASVTVDGWAVIAVIAVLGLLSGDVMVLKLLQLSRAERGDRRFLDGFSARWKTDVAQIADGAAPDRGNAAASPLSRMYVRGLAELRSALSESAELRIPAEYLGLIRSALDTGIVEETDALNRRLVLMTIAVSGGPFLGLLGTVAGVMITFASIAATGDVNVNTIAPGVAAALFATVAGLLVAIPSLFGYNFIASRISARVSAMEVFADQLVARFSASFAGRRKVQAVTHAA
jgi:biopolymer transport protein ExbB